MTMACWGRATLLVTPLLSSLTIVMVVILMISLQTPVHAVKCFECNVGLGDILSTLTSSSGYKLKPSDNHPNCKDPFLQNAPRLGQCEGDYCFKMRSENPDTGEVGIMRNCGRHSTSNVYSPEPSTCGPVKGVPAFGFNLQLVGWDMQSCNCTTDLCNDGNQAVQSSLYAATCLIVSLFYVLF